MGLMMGAMPGAYGVMGARKLITGLVLTKYISLRGGVRKRLVPKKVSGI